MGTKIEYKGKTAYWSDEDECWVSKDRGLEDALNAHHNDNVMPSGANPFPAGVALDLAKELFSDLKVLSESKPPKFDPKVIY